MLPLQKLVVLLVVLYVVLLVLPLQKLVVLLLVLVVAY